MLTCVLSFHFPPPFREENDLNTEQWSPAGNAGKKPRCEGQTGLTFAQQRDATAAETLWGDTEEQDLKEAASADCSSSVRKCDLGWLFRRLQPLQKLIQWKNCLDLCLMQSMYLAAKSWNLYSLTVLFKTSAHYFYIVSPWKIKT